MADNTLAECDTDESLIHSGEYNVKGVMATSIERVTKIYNLGKSNAHVALTDINLEIAKNEFFTLLGPSGCGKTTLLKILAGFEQPTSGTVRIFATDVVGLMPNRRPINTVFQNYALFPHLTVWQNVGFGLKMQGVDKNTIKATTDEMLSLVHMSDHAHRKPEQLSGGQKQRVALARALTPKPKILLLDEPLSALDLKLRQAMRWELKTMQRETGITFVLVTHDQEEALAMSDRIAVFCDGKLQQIGTPREIYNFPKNRFVADFIGESNLVSARVVNINGDLIEFETMGLNNFEIAVSLDTILSINQLVTLSIRPERIIIDTENTLPEKHRIKGTVIDSIYLGNAIDYRIQCGDSQLVVRSPKGGGRGNIGLCEGDTTHIGFDPGSVCVLKG